MKLMILMTNHAQSITTCDLTYVIWALHCNHSAVPPDGKCTKQEFEIEWSHIACVALRTTLKCHE